MTQRYFFDTLDGGRHLDDEGDPLDGPEAAKTEAVRIMADLLRMSVRDFVTSGQVRVTVSDAARTPLFHVRAMIEDVTPR